MSHEQFYNLVRAFLKMRCLWEAEYTLAVSTIFFLDVYLNMEN